MTTPEPTIDRILLAHAVRYAARGLPELPYQYGRGTLVPTEITLTYRAAPDSQLGRVYAYVVGQIHVDGQKIPHGPYGQHYHQGLDGWPDWLTEEVRLHDPDAPSAEAQPEPVPGADLIEDYLRFLRGLGPQPDLSQLTPEQREAVAGQFEIVKALADRGPELPPLDRDPVALRLGLLAEAPAAECSAQHHAFDDGRLCIRAGQHRGDHIDERGFHWSDTVAVYPVADGTFRTGVRQPDTETPDRAAVYQALADDYEQLIADGKFAGLQDVVTHLRGLAGGAGGVAGETAGETGEGGRAVGYRSAGGRALRCLQHRPSDDAFANGDFYPVTSEDLPDGGVCTFPVTVDERCGVDVLIPQEADHG